MNPDAARLCQVVGTRKPPSPRRTAVLVICPPFPRTGYRSACDASEVGPSWRNTQLHSRMHRLGRDLSLVPTLLPSTLGSTSLGSTMRPCVCCQPGPGGTSLHVCNTRSPNTRVGGQSGRFKTERLVFACLHSQHRYGILRYRVFVKRSSCRLPLAAAQAARPACASNLFVLRPYLHAHGF